MRGKPFPKGSTPHNKTAVRQFVCPMCLKVFERTEAYIAAVGIPKSCSRVCHNRRVAAETKLTKRNSGELNPVWRGGIQTYRRKRKDACERCGSKKFLEVHHKNEDRYDNRDENLETLCKSCHHKHHRRAQNFTKNSSFRQPPLLGT